ncbi:hypothetical protein D3C84_1241340 [compost metagenome]
MLYRTVMQNSPLAAAVVVTVIVSKRPTVNVALPPAGTVIAVMTGAAERRNATVMAAVPNSFLTYPVPLIRVAILSV